MLIQARSGFAVRLTKEEINSIRDDPREPLSRILPAEGAEGGAYRVLVMQLADLERLWQVPCPRCLLLTPSSLHACSAADCMPWQGMTWLACMVEAEMPPRLLMHA